ncbi:hypothetical protein ABZ626_23650 [Streptomyces longispororuber]|uniref:hypothetical protein n=1 Tax=Streptomyces longispororuber TaxID=68230 RepID=UPI0033C8CA02
MVDRLHPAVAVQRDPARRRRQPLPRLRHEQAGQHGDRDGVVDRRVRNGHHHGGRRRHGAHRQAPPLARAVLDLAAADTDAGDALAERTAQ